MRRVTTLALVLAAISLMAVNASTALAGYADGYLAYKAGDYTEAIRQWMPAAMDGDANAAYGLGVIYEQGLSVPKDLTEAALWYRVGANAGSTQARERLNQLTQAGQLAEPLPRTQAPATELRRDISGGEAIPYARPARQAINRFDIRVGVGVAFLSYEQEISDIIGLGGEDTDYSGVGPAVEVSARFHATKRVSLGVDWQAAFIGSDTETSDNIAIIAGSLVDQRNDLEVVQHLIDVLAQYTFGPTTRWEIKPFAGWHWLLQDFERSNFLLDVAEITIPVDLAPVSEDFRGHGPLLGTEVSYRAVPEKLEILGDARVVRIVDMTADNSLLGEVESDGWSYRWAVGVARPVGPGSLGLRYQGQFQRIDQSSSAVAVLPENETWVHAFFLTATLTF